jgi:hypothetical protein
MSTLEAPKQITMENPLNSYVESKEEPTEESHTNADECICCLYSCWCFTGCLGLCFAK